MFLSRSTIRMMPIASKQKLRWTNSLRSQSSLKRLSQVKRADLLDLTRLRLLRLKAMALTRSKQQTSISLTWWIGCRTQGSALTWTCWSTISLESSSLKLTWPRWWKRLKQGVKLRRRRRARRKTISEILIVIIDYSNGRLYAKSSCQEN